MIVNLIEQVETVVKEVLAVRVSKDQEVYWAVNVNTQTYVEVREGEMPKAHQVECVSVWLVADDDHQRFSTTFAIPIEEYTETGMRNHTIKAWDAFLLRWMEEDLTTG